MVLNWDPGLARRGQQGDEREKGKKRENGEVSKKTEKTEKGFELELGSGKGEGKSRRIRKDLFLRVLQMGLG